MLVTTLGIGLRLHQRAALRPLLRYQLRVPVHALRRLLLRCATLRAHVQLPFIPGINHAFGGVEEVVEQLRLRCRLGSGDYILAAGGDHRGLDRASSLSYPTTLPFHIYITGRLAIR